MSNSHPFDPGLAGKSRGDLLNALGACAIPAASADLPWTQWGFGLVGALGVVLLVAALIAHCKPTGPNAMSRLAASLLFSYAIIATAAIMFILSLVFPEQLGVLWSTYGFVVAVMIFAQLFFLFSRYDEDGFWWTFACTSLLAISCAVFSVTGILKDQVPLWVMTCGILVPAFFWASIEGGNIKFSWPWSKLCSRSKCVCGLSVVKSIVQVIAAVFLVISSIIGANLYTGAFIAALVGTILGMITGVFSYVLKHALGEQTVVEQTLEDRVAYLESLVSRTRPRAMAVFERPDTMKARD